MAGVTSPQMRRDRAAAAAVFPANALAFRFRSPWYPRKKIPHSPHRAAPRIRLFMRKPEEREKRNTSFHFSRFAARTAKHRDSTSSVTKTMSLLL